MTYVITSACIGVKGAACVDVCPVDAIHDGGETYLIDPDACIGCGACEAACPVSAIFEDSEVPESEKEWIEKNRNW